MVCPMISPVAASQCLAVPLLVSREDRLAIGAEGHGLAHVLMLENQPEGLAGVGIPEPHRVVATGGEKASCRRG